MKRAASITIDFDGTLIQERLLIEWVIFLLLQFQLPPAEKLKVLLKSFCRGLASLLFSHFSSTSQWAVKTAYKTFQNVEVKSLHDLILQKSSKKKDYAINLNSELIETLKKITTSQSVDKPTTIELAVCSQGSPAFAIELFLKREDVVAKFEEARLLINSLPEKAILANRLECVGGRFTGRLMPPVITKFSKLRSLPASTLFIGDDKDEAVLRRIGKQNIYFLNVKRLTAESLDRCLKRCRGEKEG